MPERRRAGGVVQVSSRGGTQAGRMGKAVPGFVGKETVKESLRRVRNQTNKGSARGVRISVKGPAEISA